MKNKLLKFLGILIPMMLNCDGSIWKSVLSIQNKSINISLKCDKKNDFEDYNEIELNFLKG